MTESSFTIATASPGIPQSLRAASQYRSRLARSRVSTTVASPRSTGLRRRPTSRREVWAGVGRPIARSATSVRIVRRNRDIRSRLAEGEEDEDYSYMISEPAPVNYQPIERWSLFFPSVVYCLSHPALGSSPQL